MYTVRVCMSVFAVAAMGWIGPNPSSALAQESAPDPAVEQVAEAAEAVAKLQSAFRGKDEDLIGDAVTDVAGLYEDIEDKALRSKMRKAVAKALRHKSKDLKLIGIDALTRMGDPLAWKYIGPFLRQANPKQEPPFFDAALRALKTLRPEQGVSDLLKLIKRSKKLSVASRAMSALGVYGDSRLRGKILKQIISTVSKEKPGVKGRENLNLYGARGTGAEARNRWEALAPAMVSAANALTGQDLGTAPAWFDFYRRNKSKPERLYVAS